MVPLVIPARRSALVVFFVLVFVITWGFWIPTALAGQGTIRFPVPSTVAGLAGAYGPSLVGILLTATYQGRKGLKMLFRRLGVVRVGIGWYLFVLLWPAALSLATTGLAMLLGYPAPDFSNPPVLREYPAPPEAFSAGFLPLLPMVLVTQFLGSSLGEEFGWRGFALPRLQARSRSLWASVILGVLWGLWHLPRLLPSQWPLQVQGSTFAWFMVSIIMTTILYTWVFNNTRGSLWPMLLFHTSQAVTTLFLSAADVPALSALVQACLVATVVLVYGPDRLSRRTVPETEGA
jgi:membrane protease YdiL (CAAX protease family)